MPTETQLLPGMGERVRHFSASLRSRYFDTSLQDALPTMGPPQKHRGGKRQQVPEEKSGSGHKTESTGPTSVHPANKVPEYISLTAGLARAAKDDPGKIQLLRDAIRDKGRE